MTDDEVFDAVQRLVGLGQYRDELLGPPGSRLGGGGVFYRSADGVRQRVYVRGSAHFTAAQEAGGLERLPILTPATRQAVAEAEMMVGHPLPPLLRRLYLEVGNGGFGPGYGILGVRGGEGKGGTAIDLYRQGSWNTISTTLLPICDWGCAILSLVDCSPSLPEMWGFDPNPGPIEHALFPQSIAFTEWLARWVAVRLFQPTLCLDPNTGEWRGAADDET